MSEPTSPRAAVLVEGTSDERALRRLAARRGRDLDSEGISVVPIGGAHALGHFLVRYGPDGLGMRLAGLCDASEERVFAQALERADMGSELDRLGMEELGFYVCDADLENELVRALGAEVVERVIEGEGELSSFRTFQKQPAKRALDLEEQLWRFMWNRKIRYAPLLVDALDLDHAPRPLDGVLASV